MPRRILDTTNHMLMLYRHHVGQTEVPMCLHDAALHAAVAASVEDRVWIEKFRGRRLTPSLYTFMVAPSAIGKGEAFDTITPYIEEIGINHVSGIITAEKLLERMSGTPKKGEDDVKKSKIFLTQEELAMCIGTGPQAFNFVKHMTGLYKRGVGKTEKGTITGANAVVYKQNINWMAGTTRKWMVTSIPPEAIEGGFIGRLYGVHADYDLDIRYDQPIYPHDYEEVRDHLMKRFEKLARIEGPFRVTAKARAIEKQWYDTRPKPEDEAMIPSWKRQQDMLWKFAMNFALCESHMERHRVIQSRHILQARDIVITSDKAIKGILHATNMTHGGAADVELVRETIKKAGKIQRSQLMLLVARKGLDKRRLDNACETLLTENTVASFAETRQHGPAARIYKWAGGQTLWS